jgi:hypothetical protein
VIQLNAAAEGMRLDCRMLRLLVLMAACGSEKSSEAVPPDLSPHLCSGAQTPPEIACCPNDSRPIGACSDGDRCDAFELACRCIGDKWCCEEGGNPIHGCQTVYDCHRGCGGAQLCLDDCDQSANQPTLDLVAALEACVSSNCISADGGAPACFTGPCNGAYYDCLGDHPDCWF